MLQNHAAFFDFDSDGVLSLSDTYKGMRAIGFNFVLAALGTAIIHASFSLPTTPPVAVRLPGRREPLFSLRLPDPFLRVFIANIHKGKHGSDSGTYDTEGRYIPEKLEEIFSKYAGMGDSSSSSFASVSSVSMAPAEVAKKKAAAAAASLTLDETKGKGSAGSVLDVGVHDSLTWSDIRLMLKGNRSLFDPFGSTAAFLEWSGLFWLAAERRASDGRFVVTRERARAAADGTLFSVLKRDRERAAEERAEHQRVAKTAAAAVERSRGLAGGPKTATGTKKKTAEGGSGGGGAPLSSSSGGIAADRRSPPPPATQFDFAPHPPTAKKAQ